MKDVFDFRNRLIDEYAAFSRSFSRIAAPDLAARVVEEYGRGRYWPEPLIQINPNYKRDSTVQKLVKDGSLHPACAALFQTGKVEGKPADLHLYKHQMQAIAKAQNHQSYVVTTGTGSGKPLSFFIPVIDRILKAKQADPAPRTRAIVIYPMNALANSQLEELDKFLHGYPSGQEPFSVKRYTGQESSEERKTIADNPPDILLTNFMMLELILTRFEDIDRRVVDHCRGLEFLVLDELHTYRGRQGADVAMLVRRIRERMQTESLVCIGTSATISSADREDDRNQTVADVASLLFGTRVTALDVIGETLERVTNPARDVAVPGHGLSDTRCPLGGGPDFDAAPLREAASPPNQSTGAGWSYILSTYIHLELTVANKTAKLFVNGGSQAVRLPAEFRFDNSDGVFIRRDAVTGDVILSARRTSNAWRDFFALRDQADVPADFMNDRPLNEPLKPREFFEDR